ncbi:MAG: SDR family oxidoreductase [Pirellulaceae bacterium]|nr:SDR family oxidoreductase [Planctomycetales bacterium]
MDFLQFSGKVVVVFGVANRKSIAWNVGQSLESCGATVVYVVRSESRREGLAKLMGEREVLVCDVEFPDQIERVRDEIAARHPTVHGLLHSIAFADYDGGIKPFHETGKQQFLRTMDISCYSFIALANAFKPILDRQASVVTMSISTTKMASESYGFMAPVKAALDSSLAFLTKSFSADSEVRFNAVGAGLLKTSASAGIPGYVDSYLYAEQVIPRGRALETREAADTAVFLLSPRSSGIVAQTLVVDAGMAINYFDATVVKRVVSNE